jgi:hypothetical protein
MHLDTRCAFFEASRDAMDPAAGAPDGDADTARGQLTTLDAQDGCASAP